MNKILCSRNWNFLIKLVSAWKNSINTSIEVVNVWQPFIDFTGTRSLLLLLNVFFFFPSLCTLLFQVILSQNKFYWKRIKEWETPRSYETDISKFHCTLHHFFPLLFLSSPFFFLLPFLFSCLLADFYSNLIAARALSYFVWNTEDEKGGDSNPLWASQAS